MISILVDLLLPSSDFRDTHGEATATQHVDLRSLHFISFSLHTHYCVLNLEVNIVLSSDLLFIQQTRGVTISASTEYY